MKTFASLYRKEFFEVPTPSYVVAKDLLEHNLCILHEVEESTGAHVLLGGDILFQLADVAADAGLRGIKHIGDLGQVVIPPGRLTDNFKLLEIHDSLRHI